MTLLLEGQANVDIATQVLGNQFDPGRNGDGFDPGRLRPFVGNDGRSYCTVKQNGKLVNVPLVGNTATLRRDDWIALDQAIVKAAKPRLKAVADLRGAGLVYNIPNGMGKTVLETETQSDINEATVSMDGLRESQGDRPQFNTTMLPLPLIHKDFSFSMRQIMASRNGGSPLDTTTAELAGRRVAETVEALLLGTQTGLTFGGGQIFGYTNYTNRNTKVLTAPTAGGWTGATAVLEVLQMRAQAQADLMFGPYMLYTSPNWDVYLDNDFSTAKGDLTLRQRIKQIEGITDVRTLDYLTGYTFLLIQMTADVARMVIGMEITTVQWESQGGMKKNFKVMCIMVPQIRADYNSNCGIVHGASA